MGSPLYFDRKIVLNPLEQRYIATCDCVDDYPHSDKTREWKGKLALNSRNDTSITVRSSEMLLPFPTLAYLIGTEGLGDDWPVIEYFEGLDDRSHNHRLHEMARRAAKNPKIPQELLRRMENHATDCSVSLVRTDEKLDDPFDVKPSTNYVLTHGRYNGMPVIIREATDNDVAKWGDIYR